MRTNGVACPCISVVRLIVCVRCMERPLIEVPLYCIHVHVCVLVGIRSPDLKKHAIHIHANTALC